MTAATAGAEMPQQTGAVAQSTPTQPKKQPLTGPATRSYNLAEEWDRTAGLSDSDNAVLDKLAQTCSCRPYPPQIIDTSGTKSAAGTTTTEKLSAVKETPDETGRSPGSNAALDKAILENSHQFYLWHGELEAARRSETEEKYRKYGEVLESHLSTCSGLLSQVDETLSMFERLQEQHKAVDQKTRTIHDSCEKLVEEKDHLVRFAEALRTKLAYFDELETIAAKFHSASLSVEGPHFLPMLKRLDECITFVSSNPQYAESATYQAKFRQLQSRALATIRSRVKSVLDKASAQVTKAIKGGHAAKESAEEIGEAADGDLSHSLSDGAETAVLYVRFRAAAEPSLKGLLAEIESRGTRPEYTRLATELQTLFCETRLHLVGQVVENRITQLSGLPIQALARNGCAYLMQVCHLEHQLFEHFFPAAAAEPGAMRPLVEPMCNILYDVLRPICIAMSDIDQLCEVVDIMRHEILQEQLGRRGNAVAPVRPIIQRALQDAQERLTFRAQAYLKDSVASYFPTSSDTDYPGRLVAAAQARSPEDGAAQNQIPEVVEAQAQAGGSPEKDSSLASMDPYSLWYPPLQRSLLLLSKVYRCLPKSIFGGLAHEAVASTTASIKQASQMVARRSGPTDGQLYMIKHLLILREQIAPFEAEFAVSEKDLDFGHMRDQLRRIMAGESSLFVFSSSNAMLQLVGNGVRVMESTVDSKKDLEKLLKATCESFIMSITKLIVEPMLSFITKVTAVKVSTSASRPIREHAFASPGKLNEMIGKVNHALDNALPKV
mmetsp:Transcript_38034/g.90364  ORF Transcript_38034/g.90364 Transcript_38034/m.90364 type:complete len:779 (+) Transcript_38034:255-2591(+)